MPPPRNILVLLEFSLDRTLAEKYGDNAFLVIRDEVVERLDSLVRERDELRQLGRNRWLLILKGVSDNHLQLALTRLKALFDEPLALLDEMISLDLAFGYATVKPDLSDLKEAIRGAGIDLRKRVLQAGKDSAGPPRAHHGPGRGGISESDVGTALELGEFRLYLRPKFHAKFRSVLGAEALLRWHRKDERILEPAAFMGAVKNTPVMKKIDTWVLRNAVAGLAKCSRNMSISVHVTTGLLDSPEFRQIFLDAVDLFGINPRRIFFEIDENYLMDEPEQAFDTLCKIKAAGAAVSISNFANTSFEQHNSLKVLAEVARNRGYGSAVESQDGKAIPVDEVKIEKRFIRQMGQVRQARNIVSAIVELAKQYRLQVVAQGIDENAREDELAALGCDALQGDALAPPLLFDAFEEQYLFRNKSPGSGRNGG